MAQPTQRPLSFNVKYEALAPQLITSVAVAVPVDLILQASNPLIPSSKLALWDTGANRTVISKRLADELDLVPIDEAVITHADGQSTVYMYAISLILPNSGYIPYMQVFESELPGGEFDVLIGMDVITLGDFVISNYDRQTSFSFRIPSLKHLNLVNEDRHNELRKNHLEAQSLKG